MSVYVYCSECSRCSVDLGSVVECGKQSFKFSAYVLQARNYLVGLFDGFAVFAQMFAGCVYFQTLVFDKIFYDSHTLDVGGRVHARAARCSARSYFRNVVFPETQGRLWQIKQLGNIANAVKLLV